MLFNIIMKFIFPTFLSFLLCLIIFIFLDAIYFFFTKNLYSFINQNNIVIYYAFLSWISLAFAISSSKPNNIKQAIIYGGLLGLIVYSVFNSVELTINPLYRKNKFIAIVDILWGITICSIVSLIHYKIIINNNLNPNSQIL